VNYEAGTLLRDAVASILADDSAGPPEVVVVDNGSRDGSVARLRAAFPDVPVLDAGGNVGYAAAANLGTERTTAPVVVVSNPDLVVRPGTARAMLARFDAELDVGAVGPLLLDPDGNRYPSARREPAAFDALAHALLGVVAPRNRFTRRYRQPDLEHAQDVDWVSGAMVWLRRAAVDSVGGWDEGYFMFAEDVDLCWRLRRLGWRIVYDPAGAVTHVQGASTNRHPYRTIVDHHRSTYRFATKRWQGARRVLLPFAAVVLTARATTALLVRAVRTLTRGGS
jgi:N-acetylglucosaminyl-diphospho-decaprenol L-rhamnosyltransferase